jgi:hypothetical protein
MHELIAIDDDADVRRAWGDGGEEHKVAWREVVATDCPADAKLFACFPRHRHTVQAEHVLDEAAAVETVRRRPTVPIRGSAQRERRASKHISVC